MPEQQLSAEWATDLLNYLEEPDVGLEKSPYRKLDLLRKYERIEPKIICKALRIVSNHYEESPFVFSLYVFGCSIIATSKVHIRYYMSFQMNLLCWKKYI